MIEISKVEAGSLLDFIELNIFDVIRNDIEIDNMNWLVNIVNIYLKCKEAVDNDDGM